MTSYVDLKIDPIKNDIAYENGKVKLTHNEDEVMQRIRTRLRRVAGEWFLDISAGLPYYGGEMLGSKDANYVMLLIRAEILQTEGVGDVEDISVNYNRETRAATINARVKILGSSYKITEEIK